MGLTWTTPSALWLLAAVPLVWVALRFSRTSFNPRQRLLQAVVRSIALAAIAMALARPVISAGSSRLSVVYLVDVSHSIAGQSITDAAKKIDELNGAVRPDHSRIVAFGADAAVVETTAALRTLAELEPTAKVKADMDRAGTDLDVAFAQARAALAPGHVPRIVLFSDGRPTSGAVREAIARLTSEGIPVHVVPMQPRDLHDTWVDGIVLPDRLAAGALFTATVRVGSQRAGPATVELRVGGKPVATKVVPLVAGMTDVPMDVAIDDPGAKTIEARVTATADPLAANDAFARGAWVAPRAKVLYIEGAAEASTRYLSAALRESGFEVDVRPSGGLPATREQFDPWDVVILSDLSRKAISESAMRAMGDWVEHGGGGLLVAGGDAVYGEGEGGYRRTELERLTPVTFERRDEPEIALIIVLDKSWSMAGQVMELCKAAAQAAVDALGDEQSVGIVTFNDGMDIDVPLMNVGKNRDEIRKKVSAIEPGGHTLIYPAVEQAYKMLVSAKARAKHVVLLSDGRSYPDDYEGLVKKMVAAKMTVSSIAVGPAADAELLSNIARWGKGRNYAVEDAKEVPQIFVKEAKNIPTPSFDEKGIKTIVKHAGFLEGVDLAHMPLLKGRTATVMKDTAQELLSTTDGDPILAFWPIGAGRTAVFASDVKDRWATDWVKWRGYGPFFSSVVRGIQRQRPLAASLSVEPGPIRGGTRPFAIAVEARDAQGNARDWLQPHVRVRSGAGEVTEVSLRQVAPGRYETRAILDAYEPLTVDLVGPDAGVTSQVIVPDPNAEYRFRAPDETLLKSIASATGGTWMPTAQGISNTAGEHRTARRPLWPLLAWIALIGWLADLVLRRVRVFEPA